MSSLLDLAPDHPARMLANENSAFRKLVAHVRADAQDACDLPDSELDPALAYSIANDTIALGRCVNHYRLKEESLVPALADRGETHVQTCVQNEDDRVRTCIWMAEALLQGAVERPSGANLESAAFQLQDACDQIETVADHEDEGLIPLALEILDEKAWRHIASETKRPEYLPSAHVDLWTSPIDRAEAAIRRAIASGKLPGAAG